MTDIFANGNTEIKDFFETKDLQLQNGCYYKIYIAYRLEKQVDKKIIINYKGKEYKEVCEEYMIYINKDTDSLSPNDTPRKEIGKTTYSTEKDKGFAGYSDLKRDDPHFGWSLGTFSINGFTSDTEYNGKTYYLKNVGDRVTLWFHLNQDINALNGDAKLTISEDKNGYDQYFQIPETNFKHGALIIRYTDKENKSSDPIIYTDFLAAAATPFADTKVQLFEEGDYEVSLDYEIKDQRGEFNAIPKYTNYKMSFSFSIRNGNCMVYPFDIKTKSELSDFDVTPNGFKLDMAKSRYLEVSVIREAVKIDTDGTLKTDVRFNRPAKDGDVYDEEGIYTFKVNNKYTGEVTEKTLFVGSDSYIMALAKAE